jgi:hypothetical protein
MVPSKQTINKNSTSTSKQLEELGNMQDTAVQLRQDDATFPFLSLPGEIRNMIYEYVLVDKNHPVEFRASGDNQRHHSE